MKEKLSKLVEVKSLVTLILTLTMAALIFLPGCREEMLPLFSAAYGSVITYFFTRKQEGA
ncbi:MAG: hypothetical protein IJC58_07040 [Oscillospiraceae bacterium]|nr:hypothetical protein [Oscillospiraceae bacterium]